MARPAGLEPATPGLEGRCSIQLSYGRKLTQTINHTASNPAGLLRTSMYFAHWANLRLFKIAPSNFVEPATPGLEGRCSIQLSSGRRGLIYQSLQLPGTLDSLPFPTRYTDVPSKTNLVRFRHLGKTTLFSKCAMVVTWSPIHRNQTPDHFLNDRIPWNEPFKKWSGQRDSNPRPSAPKADALPDCAMPRRSTPPREL